MPSQPEWEELFSDGRMAWADDKAESLRRRFLGSLN